MLAFNLGVFFRNMAGEEVIFSARNQTCAMKFIGGVTHLSDQTTLTHHLAVTLTKDNLSCHISFEESEDEENVEDTEVDVLMTLTPENEEEEDTVLLETTFRFEEITLKPAAGAEGDPDDGPLTA